MRIFLSITSFILVIAFAMLSVYYGVQEKWVIMVLYIFSSFFWLISGSINTYLAIEEK